MRTVTIMTRPSKDVAFPSKLLDGAIGEAFAKVDQLRANTPGFIQAVKTMSEDGLTSTYSVDWTSDAHHAAFVSNNAEAIALKKKLRDEYTSAHGITVQASKE